jgi:hypothetical protein
MEVERMNRSIDEVGRAAPPYILEVVDVMDELLVSLMPPRRRVSFLLGGAVSSSMLQGDSKTECLLKDVIEDGLDDDDPFFLVKRLVVFFHMIAALFSLIKLHVSTGN